MEGRIFWAQYRGYCVVDVQVYAGWPSLGLLLTLIVLTHIAAVIPMLTPFHKKFCSVLITLCPRPVYHILACVAKVFWVDVGAILVGVNPKYHFQ